jgi:hypothetical protein
MNAKVRSYEGRRRRKIQEHGLGLLIVLMQSSARLFVGAQIR